MMRTIARLLLVAVLGVAAPASRVSAATESLAGPSQAVPASYFGMVIHRALAGTPWPAVKFGAWRFWDNRIAWPHVQTARDRWDFTAFDRSVDLAERFRLETLYTFSLTPAWASARPSEPSGYGRGLMAEPRDLEDWRLYVRTIAERYKGRIRHWELWNEVNDKQRFYSGTLETMVEMARIAHGELKAADPSSLVLSPNFTGPFRETLDVLDRYLALGGMRYADGLAYHFYLLEGRKPETLRDYVGGIRKVLEKHGLRDMPIWNTESGLRNENADGAPEDMKLNDQVWPKLSADLAAARTARSLIVGWMVGMQRFFWYSWDHTSYGLMEQSSKRPKPAAIAYGEVYRWMTGNVVRGCQIVDEIWSCEMENTTGRKAWMVWHAGERNGQVPITVAQAIAEVHDLKGEVAAVPAGTRSRSVDGSPVLLAQRGFLGPR